MGWLASGYSASYREPSRTSWWGGVGDDGRSQGQMGSVIRRRREANGVGGWTVPRGLPRLRGLGVASEEVAGGVASPGRSAGEWRWQRVENGFGPRVRKTGVGK